MRTSTPQAAENTFDSLEIGQTFSCERAFSTADIDAFAAVSGDHSPLHMDEGYARASGFDGRVVHGMLLASLFSQLVGMQVPGRSALYLGQDLAFRNPAVAGDRVVANLKVTAKVEATRSLVMAGDIRNSTGQTLVSGTARVKCRSAASAIQPTARAAVTPGADRSVAIVTGGSRGIGAEICRVLGKRGYSIVVVYHSSESQAQSVVADIRAAGGDAFAIRADLSADGEIDALVSASADRFGRVDGIVNAAVGELVARPFHDMTMADFTAHFDMQVRAVGRLCQQAYPLLKAQGGGIVSVLSQVVDGVPPPQMAGYVAAKYALKGLSKALAVEWAPDGIRVNSVSPGLTQTELTQHYPERMFKMEASRTPLRRIALTRDIAQAVAFLLSKEADFITGVELPVSGGQWMP